MKRREDPAPAGPPPPCHAKVAYILARANAARERGENMQNNPDMDLLERECGVQGRYCFAFTSDDYRFSSAELADLAERLVRGEAP